MLNFLGEEKGLTTATYKPKHNKLFIWSCFWNMAMMFFHLPLIFSCLNRDALRLASEHFQYKVRVIFLNNQKILGLHIKLSSLCQTGFGGGIWHLNIFNLTLCLEICLLECQFSYSFPVCNVIMTAWTSHFKALLSQSKLLTGLMSLEITRYPLASRKRTLVCWRCAPECLSSHMMEG